MFIEHDVLYLPLFYGLMDSSRILRVLFRGNRHRGSADSRGRGARDHVADPLQRPPLSAAESEPSRDAANFRGLVLGCFEANDR